MSGVTNRKLDNVAAALAAQQYGAFGRRQVGQDSAALRALDRRIEWGAFDRLASGVYAPRSAVKTWEHELSAALLAHPGAVISHRAAAAMHGWPSYREGVVELTGSYSANCRSRGDIHRTKD